jgi:hypothetical protein
VRIEILGSGCYKCIRLEEWVNEVAAELGAADIEIVRVTDEREIRRHMPPDETPGLRIDGVLVSTRDLPARQTLAGWLLAERAA